MRMLGHRLTVRLYGHVYDQVKAIAETERRTLGQVVNLLALEALAARAGGKLPRRRRKGTGR